MAAPALGDEDLATDFGAGGSGLGVAPAAGREVGGGGRGGVEEGGVGGGEWWD